MWVMFWQFRRPVIACFWHFTANPHDFYIVFSAPDQD
jgi:hypothetical protein